MNNKRLKPNIVRGGIAIPIANKKNYYYMKGRKHEQGGIDIGKNPRTGLEVEDGEVMHISPTEVKVFSSIPFLNGKSPAQKVISGENPTKVFNQQESYKNRNDLNDDGTKKKAEWGMKEGSIADIATDMIPVVGTLKEITRFARNPSWEQAGWVGTSLAGDLLGFGIGKLITGIAKSSKAAKMAKARNAYRSAANRMQNETKKYAAKREAAKRVLEENDESIIRSVRKQVPITPFEAQAAASFTQGTLMDWPINLYQNTKHVDELSRKQDHESKSKSRYGTKKNSFEKIKEIQSLANNVSTLENPIISPDYTPYYDTTEVGKLINHSENPDSIGFDKVTRRWYAPKGKSFDKDNFGMGVDRYTGGNISDKIKKDSKGREYITEEDERDIRHKRIKSANQSAKRRIDFIRKYYNDEGNVTETKEALITNLIYNRGSGKTARVYFNPENEKYVPMQKAILRGTDDEIREEINKIYKEAGLANRDSLINDFYKKRNKKRMGGLSRYKDYDSKSKPYPNVDKKDFAGKNRSYPIPTKADAVDALRLAGLHERNDIKAKVYNKYPELRKRAKNGGVYTVTSNGKTSLRMIPSTGERIKFKNGGTEDIEKTVTLIPEFYSLGLEDELANKINQPIVNYHTPVEKIKYDILDTNGRFNPTTGVDLNTKRDYDNRNDIMKKQRYNSLISDGIGIASNIVGSIIGYNANKKALEKMKYAKAPINLIPSKLKTSININPQLDAIRDQQQAYERQIDANTASSRVALGRKQLGRLNTIKLLNNIYANKENTETELINKDRLNQQTVANQNITNYNTWKEKKNAFENAIIEKQSENTIGLINSINAGVQNAIGNFEKRLTAENNIRAIAAANPNVNPIILKALGVRGITNDMIESWLRAYENKNG